MQPTEVRLQREQICYPQLPLAVYREIAAHLQQVRGVAVRLIPQDAQSFDYSQSQVSSLNLEYPEQLEDKERQYLEAILNYYGDRYGTYAPE